MENHDKAAVWLFKQSLTGSLLAAVRSCVALQYSVNIGHKGPLPTSFKAVQFLLKQYETENNNDHLDNDVRALKEGSLNTMVRSQQLWPRKFRNGSVYYKNALKELFVECIQVSILEALRYWWADLQDASLKDFTRKAELLLDLQGLNDRRKQMKLTENELEPNR